MKKFEHFKKKTIYLLLAETIPWIESQPEDAGEYLIAYHHDTLEPLTFKIEGEQYISPDDQAYALYRSEKNEKIWAREMDDFYGYKVLDDGTEVRRFTPLDERIERSEVTITIPPDFMEIVERQLKEYKKWAKENMKFQLAADQAETEEEQNEYLKKCTQHFKGRYAGIIAKDEGDRLSASQLQRIWNKFMKEYRDFLNAHTNLTFEKILEIGIDKFIYVMGWKNPSDVTRWHNNKVRIGSCCHCEDQFIPLIFQHNHGLCQNCRPLFSVKAIRAFVIQQTDVSPRYKDAHRDLLMDFYIMFYYDANLRNLFLAGSETANYYEELEKAEVTEQPNLIQ